MITKWLGKVKVSDHKGGCILSFSQKEQVLLIQLVKESDKHRIELSGETNKIYERDFSKLTCITQLPFLNKFEMVAVKYYVSCPKYPLYFTIVYIIGTKLLDVSCQKQARDFLDYKHNFYKRDLTYKVIKKRIELSNRSNRYSQSNPNNNKERVRWLWTKVLLIKENLLAPTFGHYLDPKKTNF